MSGIVIIYLLNSNFLDIHSIIKRFIAAISTSTENIRQIQANALLNGFYKNPILGSGAGVGVAEIIRSIEIPWAYEMSYHLILYNSGLIGFTLFVTSHLFILVNLFVYTKKGFKVAEGLLLAYTTILLANATNPYFTSSFDFLWFVIFPDVFFYRNNEKQSIKF